MPPVHVRAVSEAAAPHGMRGRPGISVVFARALLAGTAGAAHRKIQFGASDVTDFRRENDVVLDPAEHHHAVLPLIFAT